MSKADNRSRTLPVSIGDLWRWLVTSMALFMLIGMSIAYTTTIDDGSTAPAFRLLSAMIAGGIAAFLVWSDTVSWIGD